MIFRSATVHPVFIKEMETFLFKGKINLIPYFIGDFVIDADSNDAKVFALYIDETI